ncbi:alpha/beta hydrolase [Cyanobium sp. CH-040]|uniref:alpha/beta hydrolase n=1 Tax=Cyanobium sp. CH-040 TaxID=2823708 RepID=UPI0020CE8EAA|nr:dienelactone hydrolase family protein [Cyanobium sp. CH-040]MCP9927385.1 dienelactone hydrolase family protein [Cyanobium sp. CH-040]
MTREDAAPAPAQDSTGTDRLQRGPASARHRLVLLHGWGADADDLFELGELLVGPEVSVVALQAPLPHPAGEGRQWYDLEQPGWPQLPPARQDLRRRLLDLGGEVPLSRTAVLGFSQGAALALDVVTGASGLPVAGLICCSGYPHPGWQPERPGSAQGEAAAPVLLTHGQLDPVVPHGASEELSRQLRASGRDVELLSFSGGHTIDASLLPRLRTFLQACWRRADTGLI